MKKDDAGRDVNSTTGRLEIPLKFLISADWTKGTSPGYKSPSWLKQIQTQTKEGQSNNVSSKTRINLWYPSKICYLKSGL